MNTMMNGVIAPMTVVTLSTSRKPAASTSATMTSAPAQIGHPHCWLRLEPAPANITKPVENRVISTPRSSRREKVGLAMRSKTLPCSVARK